MQIKITEQFEISNDEFRVLKTIDTKNKNTLFLFTVAESLVKKGLIYQNLSGGYFSTTIGKSLLKEIESQEAQYDYYFYRANSSRVLYRFPYGQITNGQFFDTIHLIWSKHSGFLIHDNWFQITNEAAQTLFPQAF